MIKNDEELVGYGREEEEEEESVLSKFDTDTDDLESALEDFIEEYEMEGIKAAIGVLADAIGYYGDTLTELEPDDGYQEMGRHAISIAAQVGRIAKKVKT